MSRFSCAAGIRPFIPRPGGRIIRNTMGVPRDDLLLMMRALKRGFADTKALRKALDRQLSKPISLLDALHLPASEAGSLRADPWTPDAVKDRALLEPLRDLLVEHEDLTAADWEKFVATLVRATERHAWPPLPAPREFDGYTLQWELARRERGVVYRAKDPAGRDTAVKVFRQDVAGTEGMPRVEGLAYAAAPFEEGEPIEGRRLAPRRGAEVIEKAARALGDRPHGSLTPARILVRKDGSVAVLRFEGAAKVPLSSRSLPYAGPSDVHALAAILYEMAVGAPPSGETSPAARTRDVDPDLDKIVSSALSGGYASAAEFADDLARYRKGEPVTARKPIDPARAAGRGRSHRWMWAAAAAVLAAMFGAYHLRPIGKTPPAPPAPVVQAPPPVLPLEKPAPPPPAIVRKPAEPVAPPVEPARPLTPADEDRLYQECQRALLAGRLEQVESIAHEALARGSKKDWPCYHLAHAFVARERFDQALVYVSRALDLSPGDRDYLDLRAQIRAFRGESRKALADLEELYGRKTAELNKQIQSLGKQVAADPRDARSRVLRGAFFMLKRNFDLAAQDFTAAIDLGFRTALAWRAHARRHEEDRAGAAADARAYLAEQPAGFAADEMKALLHDLEVK
jgi:tetratricopeptide (TPR) repeat protein